MPRVTRGQAGYLEQSLVIEVDGESHADAEQIEKDQRRDRYLQSDLP